MQTQSTPKIEQIRCQSRPRPLPPADTGKGKILLRMDPTAWGRATRFDLEKQGYRVASVRTLDAEAIQRHAPDAIIFFHHVQESPEALTHLPEGLPIIVANVGGASPGHLEALAERHDYRVLQSHHGPCLHQILRALTS